MVSLTLYIFGVAQVLPVLAAGSVLVVPSLLLFTANVIWNGKVAVQRRAAEAGQTD